jgi:hypothetical protein
MKKGSVVEEEEEEEKENMDEEECEKCGDERKEYLV